MLGLWIDESILSLKRTPAEKLLLALICYRAGINREGVCKDSNKELSLIIGIHAQSVSDLVQKFEKDELLTASVSKEKANVRSISPIRKFLIPYKEKADSDLKSGQTLSGNSLDPYKEFPYIYKSIPYSLYKDRKPLEKGISKTTLKVDDVDVDNAQATDPSNSVNLDAEKEKKTPPLPPPPLKKMYGDGELQLKVRRYYVDHPGEYPTEMVPAFLDYYTDIMQLSTRNNPEDIGKERWRTMYTFDPAKKLAKWHTNYLNDQKSKKNHESPQNTQYVNGSAAGATGYGTGPGNRTAGQGAGNGKPAKRPASVKPGMFNRGSQSGRHTDHDSGGRTIRIDVDSDHQTSGDKT